MIRPSRTLHPLGTRDPVRDQDAVKRAFRKLLQSLVVLCFVASAGPTAAVGLGSTAWHGSGSATLTLAGHLDATQFAPDPAEGKHLDVKSCSKVERPAPTRHQCHRATSQAPVSSRPRPQDNGPDVARLAGYASWHALWTENGSPETAAHFAPDRATRRSAFWQVFAYAVRLRR